MILKVAYKVFSVFLVLPLGSYLDYSSAVPRKLPASDLLRYEDSDGKVKLIAKPEGWALRRSTVVTGMEKIMGKFPEDQRRVSLDIEIEEEIDGGNYIQQLVTFQSEHNSRIPAYLCLPKGVITNSDKMNTKKKAKAVLCLHPTDKSVGHKVVVGLGGREGRAYAAELAERGYVTISPAYPLMANYWPNLDELGYISGTMKAIWDNSRALDLLDSLTFVDSTRGYAAIGHSLGGHNAIYTAIFDKRIQVVVTSCGFDAFEDYYGGSEENWYLGRGWCQNRYMPMLSNYRGRLAQIPFNFPELLGALAPRPVFINAPLRDSNFSWESVDKCVSAARSVYSLLGAEKNLIVKHPDVDHSFPEKTRIEAYELIDSILLH